MTLDALKSQLQHYQNENVKLREVNRKYRERIADIEATLRGARDEIQWWVNEHRCCQGHEFEALAKIEDALGK